MSKRDDGLPQALRGEGSSPAPSAGMLRVPAEPAYLGLIGTVVKWYGGRAGLNDEQCQELEVAVDEACTNVIRHAFPEQTAGQLTVICSPGDDGLEVTIVDQGRPFNPEEGIKAAREKRSRDPASGGMGLLLIQKLTDAVHYRWDEREGNHFTLVKRK